jgi:hypothetical protein
MALNNLGVTMLEQGNFCDALKVFHDAFLVSQVRMTTGGTPGDRGVMDHHDDQHPQKAADGEEEMFILLQSARFQLVQQQQQQHQQQQHQTNGGQGQPQPPRPPFGQLQICPCDDGDVAAMKNVLECVSAFIPIRLRSSEFYDPQEQQQQQQQQQEQQQEQQQGGSSSNAASVLASMILYNKGLSYLLAHVQDKLQWCEDNERSSSSSSSNQHGDGTTTIPTSEPLQMLLCGAVASFSSAHALIQSHLTKYYHGNNGEEGRRFHSNYETLWILYVLAMLHKTFLWLSRFDHQDVQAIQARDMLSRVLADIHTCQEHLHGLNVRTSDHGATACAA